MVSSSTLTHDLVLDIELTTPKLDFPLALASKDLQIHFYSYNQIVNDCCSVKTAVTEAYRVPLESSPGLCNERQAGLSFMVDVFFVFFTQVYKILCCPSGLKSSKFLARQGWMTGRASGADSGLSWDEAWRW